MSGASPSRKALRQVVAGAPDAQAAEAVVAYIRERPELVRREAWLGAQSLAAERPEVLRAAAQALLADPAHRNQAALVLGRLYNRHQEWAALRDLILSQLDSGPAEMRGWSSGLLRIALVAPGVVSAAERDRALAEQLPLAQLAYQVQQAIRDGSKPAVAPLLGKLGRIVHRATAEGLPEVLTRLGAARAVAVVGNGSGLAGAQAAAAIEAHDFVIRMNFPVLSGHEQDTGRRTDLMLFAEPKRPDLPRLIPREAGYDALPAFGVRGFGFNKPAAEGPPHIPSAFARIAGLLTYAYPTTGFFAILLAGVVLRRPVTLFGFDFFAPGRPGHYFGQTNAALQHELTYERWYTDHVLPLLCPQVHVHA